MRYVIGVNTCQDHQKPKSKLSAWINHPVKMKAKVKVKVKVVQNLDGFRFFFIYLSFYLRLLFISDVSALANEENKSCDNHENERFN